MKKILIGFCLITLFCLNIVGCQLANQAGQSIQDQEQQDFVNSIESVS